jgi:putative component of toxin-antitoxin plasmid stabilization module
MFCMVGLKTQSFFFKFLDSLKDSIVLFKIDVKLYFRGFVF